MPADTQWPTFEVFQQDRPGRPHKNIGSVHAPDAEIALQNARDVFVRRPRCHSLWVVPATAILARTRQEIEAGILEPLRADPAGATETYLVFQKRNQRNAMEFVEHVGAVEAYTPEQALTRAVDTFGLDSGWVWWVFPEQAFARSAEEDIPSMFAPAETKTYKRPQEYRTLTMMKEVRRG
jgi:ring-1,2-phenylacetyl-CoA epoxidase subunit PaaB